MYISDVKFLLGADEPSAGYAARPFWVGRAGPGRRRGVACVYIDR